MDKDIIVTCPFDKSHRIRKYKLSSHIVKCKKQSDTTKKVSCPLNSSHIVDESHLKEHLASCSNVKSLLNNTTEEKLEEPIVSPRSYHATENWDEMPHVPPYDPMVHSASKPVIRCVHGLTKSERKQFKLNERERIANLNGDYDVTQQASSSQRGAIKKVPLHPLCNVTQKNNPMNVQENDSAASVQKQEFSTTSVNSTMDKEFSNTFQKILCNELLSDYEPDDNLQDNTIMSDESRYVTLEDSTKTNSILMQKYLELSMTSNATLYKSLDALDPSVSSQSKDVNTSNKKGNLSFSEQSQWVKDTEEQEDVSTKLDASFDMFGAVGSDKKIGKREDVSTELDASFDMFGAVGSDKKIGFTENISDANTSVEDDINKSLNSMMNKIKKMELGGEIKENDMKNTAKDLKLEDLLENFNEQMNQLMNMQSTNAKQNAWLMQEMNNLKQKCFNTEPLTMLNNPHYGTNVTENVPQSSLNCRVNQNAHSYTRDRSSSYDSSGDSSMFHLRHDNKSHVLKTPKDFYSD